MVILQENNNNFWILKPKFCENLRDFGLFGLEYLPRKTSKSISKIKNGKKKKIKKKRKSKKP